MMWALFLIISSEGYLTGFNSHLIGTYETAWACSSAAGKLWFANKQERSDIYKLEKPIYRCAPVPKQ